MKSSLKQIRSWGLIPKKKKNTTGKYPCTKHNKIMSIVGWVAILCIILTMFIAAVFKMLADYTSVVHKEMGEYTQAAEVEIIVNTKQYIDATITADLKETAIEMRTEILSLENLDQLEQDLNEGKIPRDLSDIFRKHLQRSTTVIGEDSQLNNISVYMEEGVIEDFSHVYAYNGDGSRTWEVEKRHEQNTKLYDNTINAILTQNSDIYYAEQVASLDNANIPEEYMIDYMNKEILADMYKKYGIEGLKSFTFLVPVYIDKDGDIFGNADIVNGKHVRNNKFIIVQRYSLYDYIINHNIDDMFDKHLDFEFSRLRFMILVSAFVLLATTIIILIALSHGLNSVMAVNCDDTVLPDKVKKVLKAVKLDEDGKPVLEENEEKKEK